MFDGEQVRTGQIPRRFLDGEIHRRSAASNVGLVKHPEADLPRPIPGPPSRHNELYRKTNRSTFMNQRDELTHELISAYWDGELSSDEHARVEQLLASSDVHRQTLEEIESLGGGMQMLPTYRLDDRFPQRVLELARQADPTISATTDAWTGPVPKKPA